MTLAVRRLPPSHTAVNIRLTIEAVLSEWDIPQSKISAILTDNGSNIVAALRSHTAVSSGDEDEDDSDAEEEALGDEDDESDFDVKETDHEIMFSSFKRVSCFAHTLQLVVLQFDRATIFKDAISCSHRIVSKVNSSTKATEKLIGLCGEKACSFLPYPMELHISNGRASASCEGWLRCSPRGTGVGQSSNKCVEDSSVDLSPASTFRSIYISCKW